MMAIVVLLGTIAMLQVKVEKSKIQAVMIEKGPEVIKGNYTIIQYTDAGWINPIYVSEYCLDGQVLEYTEKGSLKHKPISFDGIRIVDGWVEGDELMQYGYWIPSDFDL
jgi:hypothetical protein